MMFATSSTRSLRRPTMVLNRFLLGFLLSTTFLSNHFNENSSSSSLCFAAAEQEYPIALNPFHVEYVMEDGSSELPVNDLLLLSATRSYLSYMLSQDKQEFVRVLLYHFVRSQDNSSIVSYSGSAYFASNAPPTFSAEIYNATYLSFLGHNQSRYKSWLATKGIHIQSATLTTANGEAIEYNHDEIIFPEAYFENPDNNVALFFGAQDGTNTEGDDDDDDGGDDDDDYAAYLTGEEKQMDPHLSKMIYLVATLVPLSLLLVLGVWWLLRRVKNNVEWGGNQKADPTGDIWKSDRRLADLVFDDAATVSPTNTSISDGEKGRDKRGDKKKVIYDTEIMVDKV